MILELVERIAAPLIITLHTVLEKPSADQRAVMARLVERASKLVVMSEFGRGTLIDIYGADAEQIEVIEHGRSGERSVGKEWVSTCRSRWSPVRYKKKKRK